MTLVNSEKPKKRTRASTPRVKTGCGNCRTRHIKCDETRPSCTKCVRAGWKCDGYPAPVAFGEDSENQRERQVVTFRKSSPLNISSYSIPFRIPGSQKDRQLLHYFCAQGSSDISGFLNTKFWSHTILQNSYHEPAVRQALVALSSLHLGHATSDTSSPSAIRHVPAESLQQHGKALRMLNKRLETGDGDATKVALLCCVLFFCFESTAGHPDAALRHLAQGLGILSSNLAKCGRPIDDLDSVFNVMARLDLQATMHDDDRLPFMVLTTSKERQAGVIKDPGIPFLTFEHAQRTLDKLQNWLFHFLVPNAPLYKYQPLESIPVAVLLEKEHIDQEYALWLQKFSLGVQSPDQQQTNSGIQTLLIHHRITRMLLQANVPNDDTIFGASPNPAGLEILRLTESILNSLQEKNATAETAKNPRRNVASDTGIVAPLSVLAIKCADPFIQGRATELLAISQRQEGLYDAATMARVVQDLSNVKNMRLEMAKDVGVVDSTPRSLEYWTIDVIDGEAGELIADRTAVPTSVLHAPRSSIHNVPPSYTRTPSPIARYTPESI